MKKTQPIHTNWTFLKPGFKELGSVTPSDLAVLEKHQEVADLIMTKVEQDKVNGSCEYRCPPINNDTEPQCYQPDLLLGRVMYVLK